MLKCKEDTFKVVMNAAAKKDSEAVELLNAACAKWLSDSEDAHRTIKQAAEWHGKDPRYAANCFPIPTISGQISATPALSVFFL